MASAYLLGNQKCLDTIRVLTAVGTLFKMDLALSLRLPANYTVNYTTAGRLRQGAR